MAYTPELSDFHSATLRRVAWALGRPMTKALQAILDSLDLIVDPAKVCEKCRDRSLCEECYFKAGDRAIERIPIDSLKPARPENPCAEDGRQAASVAEAAEMETEVDMKVNQVSVLVSKKIGKNFCSWSLSYGATATVEEEHFSEAISTLDTQLREMVSMALPTPNGNGNGSHPQLPG